MKDIKYPILALGVGIIIGSIGFALYANNVNPLDPIPVVSSIPKDEAKSIAYITSSMYQANVGELNSDTRSMSIPMTGYFYLLSRPITTFEIGMVIIFDIDGVSYIHQIVKIEGEYVVPLGTSNKRSDGWIHKSQVSGEFVGMFPYKPEQ